MSSESLDISSLSLPPPPPPPLPDRNQSSDNFYSNSLCTTPDPPEPPPLPERNPTPSNNKSLDTVTPSESDDATSFLLEDDVYVKAMKQRRGEIITKIDKNVRDRFRRMVGYEIERRIVKATLKKKVKNVPKRHIRSPPRKTLRKTYRHRFCFKCITSSFEALFQAVAHPHRYLRQESYYYESSKGATTVNLETEERIPTPKMLLDQDGKLQWPVFQYGGSSGSGMLINAAEGRFAPAPKPDPDRFLKQPGRENFLLGQVVESGNNNPVVDEDKTKNIAEKDSYLVGWLQVRDPNNRKQRQYVQVVNPAPQGPFRKAPWHGNIHVMKF